MTGIIQNTNSIAARQRWCKNHSLRSKIISHIYEETGLNKIQDITEDLKKNKIRQSSLQVDKFINRINTNINPFQTDLDPNLLYNISTGEAANVNITEFLLKVESNGNDLREKFIDECSKDENRFKKVIKQNKMFTFADTIKKKKITMAGKVQEVRMQRDLFGYLLGLSLEQKIDLEKVLSYPPTHDACTSFAVLH